MCITTMNPKMTDLHFRMCNPGDQADVNDFWSRYYVNAERNAIGGAWVNVTQIPDSTWNMIVYRSGNPISGLLIMHLDRSPVTTATVTLLTTSWQGVKVLAALEHAIRTQRIDYISVSVSVSNHRSLRLIQAYAEPWGTEPAGAWDGERMVEMRHYKKSSDYVLRNFCRSFLRRDLCR